MMINRFSRTEYRMSPCDYTFILPQSYTIKRDAIFSFFLQFCKKALNWATNKLTEVNDCSHTHTHTHTYT